jgi:hypothetical protein
MLLGRLLHLHPLVSIQIETLCNDDLNDLPYTTVNVKAFLPLFTHSLKKLINMRNKYVVTIVVVYHLRIINEIRDSQQLECTRLS